MSQILRNYNSYLYEIKIQIVRQEGETGYDGKKQRGEERERERDVRRMLYLQAPKKIPQICSCTCGYCVGNTTVPLAASIKTEEERKKRNTLTWYRKQIPIVWWVILRFQYTKKNRNRINDGREVRRRFHCVVVARFDETPLLHNNKRQTPDCLYSITATSNINVPV